MPDDEKKDQKTEIDWIKVGWIVMMIFAALYFVMVFMPSCEVVGGIQ